MIGLGFKLLVRRPKVQGFNIDCLPTGRAAGASKRATCMYSVAEGTHAFPESLTLRVQVPYYHISKILTYITTILKTST